MIGTVASDDRLGRGRARIDELPDGVHVRIAPKRPLFIGGFLAVWLALWTAGGVSSLNDGDATFIPFWIVGTLFAVSVLAWMALGREEVDATASGLVLRQRLGPLKRERRFRPEKVEELRASPQSWNPWSFSGGMQLYGIGGGTVAFDYGMRTHRFGASLDEAEAKVVARRVTEALR